MIRAILSGYLHDDSGATAIEYGLIAAGVAMGIVTAVYLFGDNVFAMFEYVSENVYTAWD